MGDEHPGVLHHLLAGIGLALFFSLVAFGALNHPTDRIESACGVVVAVRGVQVEGPTMRWLTVQTDTGRVMEAWAPGGLVVMPGDAACWHTYRRRFMGTSQQVYAVNPPGG